VKDALDLCLSCKGCKGDCPVNVDMATCKSEFLAHYGQGRVGPRYAYAFGWIDKWAEIASRWPGLVNLAASTPGIREFMKAATGMSPRRSISGVCAGNIPGVVLEAGSGPEWEP
jgi:hypothetical protein